MPTDVMRQTEAAKLLGVSKQYINKLVREGRVKSYTSAKLVSFKELEKFMKHSEIAS